MSDLLRRQRIECSTYSLSSVRPADADCLGLREPPRPGVLTAPADFLERLRVDEFPKGHGLDRFVQPEGLFDLYLDPKNETRRSKTAESGDEEVGVL